LPICPLSGIRVAIWPVGGISGSGEGIGRMGRIGRISDQHPTRNFQAGKADTTARGTRALQFGGEPRLATAATTEGNRTNRPNRTDRSGNVNRRFGRETRRYFDGWRGAIPGRQAWRPTIRGRRAQAEAFGCAVGTNSAHLVRLGYKEGCYELSVY
jgi:hypothetical protein